MRRTRLATYAVAAGLLLAGCTWAERSEPRASSEPAPLTVASCAQLPEAIAGAVQTYVDAFANVDAADLPQAPSAALAVLREATTELRARGDELGCDTEKLTGQIRAELALLTGGTPVQDAVLATFLADPLGTVDPSDPAPVQVEVTTTDELLTAVALAGSGSTIRLAAGTYELTQPLVVLRPVTIVGAGPTRTQLRSSAAEVGVLLDSDGDVSLRGLTVEHRGAQPASGVLVTGGGFELSDLVVTGARSTADGAGGFGVILRSTPSALRSTGSTASVTDVSVSDNQGGGVFVGAGTAPTMSELTIDSSGGCGLCFVEDSGGTVDDAVIRDAGVGVRTDDRAAPVLSDVTVRRSRAAVAATGDSAPVLRGSLLTAHETGVEVIGRARPEIIDVNLRRSTEVGIRAADDVEPTLRQVSLDGNAPAGLAVVDDARVDARDLTVSTRGEASIVVSGSATLSAAELAVSRARIGLQADRSAVLQVDSATATGTDAAVLLAGAARGSLRVACVDDAVVILTDVAAVDVSTDTSCPVVDRRD